MSPLRSGLGRRVCFLAAGTAMAVVTAAAVPAALAGYTGSLTSSQSIAPHPLLTPASFACTAPGNSSVSLTWTDPDATAADPYGAFVISGYVVERSVNGGGFAPIATQPTLASTSASDNNFALLSLGNTIAYRMRSTKSTNWVSANTSTVTATVSSIVLFVHVTCP